MEPGARPRARADEGEFFAARRDGNGAVCPCALGGSPSLKHLALKVITSVLGALLVHWLQHLSHAHLAQGLEVVVAAKPAGHIAGPLLDRFQHRWGRFDRAQCPFALRITIISIAADLDRSRRHSKWGPALER